MLPLRLFLIFFAAAATAQATKVTLPYDNFNRTFNSNTTGINVTNRNEDYPPLFWKLYSQRSLASAAASHSGGYARNSPGYWRGSPNSTPIRAYISPKEDNDKVKMMAIMDLSYKPRMSHGPRRRRSNSRGKAVPLYCWRMLIDCKVMRGRHECCPVIMPNTRRGKKSSVQPVFQDPEFGIPLASLSHQSPLRPEVQHRGSSGNMQQMYTVQGTRSQPADKVYSKRNWQHDRFDHRQAFGRCSIDCRLFTRDPCCVAQFGPQVDRFLPVEPYVQSSILENWVTTLFVLFGTNPALYLFVKKVMLVATFALAFVLWGWIGQSFGYVEIPEVFRSATDVDELTDRVISAVDEKSWLNEISSRQAGSAINKFVCCFRGGETKRSGKQIRCYRQRPKERKGSEPASALKCVSNLAYDVTVNTKDQNGSETRVF
jgi:hypothetical protein